MNECTINNLSKSIYKENILENYTNHETQYYFSSYGNNLSFCSKSQSLNFEDLEKKSLEILNECLKKNLEILLTKNE